MLTVAALFVDPKGPYPKLPGVDCWDEARDARKYDGPYPVCCHPPCQRWGRYWSGGPVAKVRRLLGDDNGCFASALASVRKYGGVIEHPEASHAWRVFAIPVPPRSGGWIRTTCGGWTCCVEQGHYGHSARKATWIYYVGSVPPNDLIWGPAPRSNRIDDGFHSKTERENAKAMGWKPKPGQRLSKVERLLTPIAFAQALLDLARKAGGKE